MLAARCSSQAADKEASDCERSSELAELQLYRAWLLLPKLRLAEATKGERLRRSAPCESQTLGLTAEAAVSRPRLVPWEVALCGNLPW